ncbi:hypothetical protein H0H87_003757 [Tephrocybe sp. NHM501043]|nr:hypothetical protein H0H87_003757 [Tephrocybe sp. NHM501043]
MSYGLIFCQQCKEPLQLDASLIDFGPSTYDMITATLPPTHHPSSRRQGNNRKAAPSSSSSLAKFAWQKARNDTPSTDAYSSLLPRAQGKQPQRALPNSPMPNESFVLLQDSVIRDIPIPIPSPARPKKGSMKSHHTPTKAVDIQTAAQFEPDHDPSPLSHHLRSTARLFNVLSSRTDIDHPLCAECTQILLHNLQRQLDETKRERDGYIAFEKEVRKEREREGQGLPKEETEKKIEKLKQEEHAAIEQLQEAERERHQLDEELRQLEYDEKALEIEEAELVLFWRAHNDHILTAEQQAAQLASLRAAYAADISTLEKLERTNVYNDAFCIGHDGVFGTINGLRLGRVPGVPVDWAEINAAWGQTLLLLYTIARKLDYNFEQ